MTGINRKNGSPRVCLSFATKRQFGNNLPFLQQLRSAFRSCEIDVTVLRSGTRVPNPTFAIAKFPAEWDFWCEIMIFHFAVHFVTTKSMLLYCGVALVCQTPLSQLRNTLAEASTVLRNGLATKCPFRRGFLHAAKFRRALFFPYFCSVFHPNSTRFFSFQFP